MKTMYQKIVKVSFMIFLTSAIALLIGVPLLSLSAKDNAELAKLTETLEIKASELKNAKEVEQATKKAYDVSIKTREQKQKEKEEAVNSINNYINSGIQKEVFPKSEK